MQTYKDIEAATTNAVHEATLILAPVADLEAALERARTAKRQADSVWQRSGLIPPRDDLEAALASIGRAITSMREAASVSTVAYCVLDRAHPAGAHLLEDRGHLKVTIQSPTVRITYACNGVTTLFSVPIQAYDATGFSGLATNTTNGAVTVLVLDSDYALAPVGTFNPTYWNLTTQTGQLVSPYAAGYELQIVLDPALTQQIQLVPGQAFPSGAIEELGDRPVQMALRLTDQLSRAISAPDGDVNPVMILPSAAARERRT